jgi:hypothetical protein
MLCCNTAIEVLKKNKERRWETSCSELDYGEGARLAVNATSLIWIWKEPLQLTNVLVACYP